MDYNFDQIIDRSNTNAKKFEAYKEGVFHDSQIKLPFKDEELIQFWIADMEFAVAPEIREALEERIAKKIFGYTVNNDTRLYDALSKWCKERYDFTFQKDELVLSNGVVDALIKLVGYILKDGEKVLITSPSYSQFANAAKLNGKEFITSPLLKDDKGNYSLDFDDLDKKMARDDVSLFIFCNPHNPTGRAWTNDELAKLKDLIEKHDIFVISDEIHCDLRRKETIAHIPLGKVMATYDKLITCMSASKSFNIAGLAESCILIRNKNLLKKWNFYNNNKVNPLSHEAIIAAYSKGGFWLKALNSYLDKNFEFLYEFFDKNISKAIVTKAETTYLAWVDFKEYFSYDENLEEFFAKEAGVIIEADKAFVSDANRMVRINLACPKSYLETGLEKMAEALKNKNNK